MEEEGTAETTATETVKHLPTKDELSLIHI